MHRSLLVLVLLMGAPAWAQDVLTIGSTSAPTGGTVQVPVFVRDVGGTTLGIDAGAGRRIGGYAFKVLASPARVASMAFARAGIAATPSPLYETTLSGSDYLSAVASFSEASPLAFTLDAAPPGNQIGTLTVTLQPSIPAGTVIPLTIHAPGAMLSSQSGTDRETIALGNLTLVNGAITVVSLAAPANLVATANGTTQVGLTWNAVAGATSYRVWRSFHGGAYTEVAAPAGNAYTDNDVTAGTTYLYRSRAVSATNETSGDSNTDAATTIVFTDEVLTPGSTTIRAVHFAEMRTAVDAMRAAASLSPVAADPTLAAGQPVLAQHLIALRAGLDQARSTIGLSPVSYTDVPPVVIKAAQVLELRSGVR